MSPKEPIIKTTIPIIGNHAALDQNFINGLNTVFASIDVALHALDIRIKKIEESQRTVNVNVKIDKEMGDTLRQGLLE